MEKIMEIILRIIGASVFLLVIYFALIKTGIVWILLIFVLLCLFLKNPKKPIESSKNAIEKSVYPIVINHACHKCSRVFNDNIERHRYTGYCFSCLANHENLLLEAFDAERMHRITDRRLYTIYINSERWRMVREKKILEAGNKCFNCESSNNLQVHHHSYCSLGNEAMTDLTVLCSECHHLLHDLRNARKSPRSRKSRELIKSHGLRAKVREDKFDVDEYLESIMYEIQGENSTPIDDVNKKIKCITILSNSSGESIQ